MGKKNGWMKAAAAVTAAMLVIVSPVSAYGAEPVEEQTSDQMQAPEMPDGQEGMPEAGEQSGISQKTDSPEEESALLTQEQRTDTEVKDTAVPQENTEDMNLPGMLRIGDKVIVNSQGVTGESYPGVTYDPETNTLTLNNAEIKGTTEYDEGVVFIMGNSSIQDEITIELIGENTISCEESLPDNRPWALMNFWAYAKVTFKGSGTLNLAGRENLRNGMLFSRLSLDVGDRTEVILDGCIINIDSGDMDADDWFMAVHSSDGMDLELKSAELNITAGSEEMEQFQGILGDAAHEAGMDVNIKAEDSKLYMIAPGEGRYGIDTLAEAEFINSDVRLEFPGDGSFPMFAAADKECTVAIDDSTTFTWIQTDGKSYYLDNIIFDIKGSPYIYIGNHASGPWNLTDKLEDAFGKDEEGRMNVWSNFIISPEKLDGDTRGDINGDGYVNLNDATLCLKHIGDQEKLTGERFTAADLTGDGTVNVADLTQLLNLVNNN